MRVVLDTNVVVSALLWGDVARWKKLAAEKNISAD